MKKSKIAAVALLGLLLVIGLTLVGCGNQCVGDGECTITIGQGATGLFVDTSARRSSCGNRRTSESAGCQVANMNQWSDAKRFGTHGCNC